MSIEEYTAPVYKWKLFPYFLLTMSLLPKRHPLLPCARFYTINGSICSQQYHLQGSLPSVCTTMSVHLPSYLSCLVSSSSPVTYNIYNHTTYIHTFLSPYNLTFIHTLILSRIHTFMHTQHIHYINSCMVALITKSLGRLHSSVSVLTYHVSSGQF